MAQRTVTTELPVKLWQFAIDASKLVEPARVEYLNRMLADSNENEIIRELQPKDGLNKCLELDFIVCDFPKLLASMQTISKRDTSIEFTAYGSRYEL